MKKINCLLYTKNCTTPLLFTVTDVPDTFEKSYVKDAAQIALSKGLPNPCSWQRILTTLENCHYRGPSMA